MSYEDRNWQEFADAIDAQIKLARTTEEEQVLAALEAERRHLDNEAAKLFDWDSEPSEEELDLYMRADHVCEYIDEIENSGIGVHLFPFEDE